MQILHIADNSGSSYFVDVLSSCMDSFRFSELLNRSWETIDADGFQFLTHIFQLSVSFMVDCGAVAFDRVIAVYLSLN